MVKAFVFVIVKLIFHSTPLAFGEGLGVRLFVLWRGVGGEALRPLESSRG